MSKCSEYDHRIDKRLMNIDDAAEYSAYLTAINDMGKQGYGVASTTVLRTIERPVDTGSSATEFKVIRQVELLTVLRREA